MIGYVTVGVRDLGRSAAFFDAVLAELDAGRVYALDRMIAWSSGPQKPLLVATLPQDGCPATIGNGTMVALMARDRRHVETVHRRALSEGGADAGPPALVDGQFYGAYFRDPDGNKFCVFTMEGPG